jgi:putative spermidine/putrescine transport system permease protein
VSYQAETRGAPLARPVPKKFSWAWVGLVPFFFFALAFMLLPTAKILIGSFQDNQGHFTLLNLAKLSSPYVVNAYTLSLKVSLVTAIAGAILGFLMAYAVTIGGLPLPIRSFLSTFSGVASNFAGVPLAFAFIYTIGRVGVITVLLRELFGINLYNIGFDLYSFWGLCLVYLYFQFPLMILVISPSLDGLRREWREASENLGASTAQYWRHIALPILLPSLLATAILLFGNAFGAYATAYALTGGSLNLVTIVIGAQIRGDVLHDPGLGYSMALGMVVIMGVSISLYSILQRRTARWVR